MQLVDRVAAFEGREAFLLLAGTLFGFELHEEEAFAIRYHHRMSLDALSHRYRNAVTKADMESTSAWKKKHCKLRKKDTLYEFIGKLL